MNIIILGAPGSGKGTQSEKLADKYNLLYVETGNIAREKAEVDPKIREIIQSGKLVPEEQMTKFTLEFLENKTTSYDNILFEGFPRYLSQYKFLEELLSSKGTKIDHTIYLVVGEETIIERLSARRTCKLCKRVYNLITNPPPQENICECGGELFQRSDDNPESIKVRLEEFRKNSLPMVDYIKSKGILIEIDGERPIDVIFNNIVSEIEAKNG
jgi:adenylate kinase